MGTKQDFRRSLERIFDLDGQEGQVEVKTRRPRVRRMWARKVYHLGDTDLGTDQLCLACGRLVRHGDVVVFRSCTSMTFPTAMHAECAAELADMADPAREFNRVRKDLLKPGVPDV